MKWADADEGEVGWREWALRRAETEGGEGGGLWPDPREEWAAA